MGTATAHGAAAHGAAVTVLSSMFSEFSRRDLAGDPADLVTSPDYIIKIFGFLCCLLLVVVCFLFWSSFCKPSNSSFKQSTENNYARGPIGMFLGNMCGVIGCVTHVDIVGRIVQSVRLSECTYAMHKYRMHVFFFGDLHCLICCM